MRGIADAQILGNLSMKPIITQTSNGRKKAFVSVAVEKRWKDSSTGEFKSNVRFIPVIAWESMATILEQYCEKGTRVFVKGRLDTQVIKKEEKTDSRTFVVIREIIFLSATNKEGKEMSVAEIELEGTKHTFEDIYDESYLTEAEVTNYFNLLGNTENVPE